MNESFGKEYKLCSRLHIEGIFEHGSVLKSYPVKLIYNESELSSNTRFQIAISVPKKNFKSAVDRNYIKRLLREAIRKNKSSLESVLEEKNKTLVLFMIFGDKQMPEYPFLEKKVRKVFQLLTENINNDK